MIHSDPWLSRVLQRSVFRLELGPEGAPALSELVEHAGAGLALFHAKVDVRRVPEVAALCALGFRVVDVNLVFDRAPAPPTALASADVSVALARPEDEAAVVDIAGRCFMHSRFHLDPLVPKGLAHRVKGEWIANYFRSGRGERLWVAWRQRQLAGFLAVIAGSTAGARTRTIDLVGVAPEHEGSGVGTALVAHFVREEGPLADRLEVGTQAANIRSARLYARTGFALARSQYVLHLHLQDHDRAHGNRVLTCERPRPTPCA